MRSQQSKRSSLVSSVDQRWLAVLAWQNAPGLIADVQAHGASRGLAEDYPRMVVLGVKSQIDAVELAIV